MKKIIINEQEIMIAENIEDLKSYFSLRFIKSFDSLEEFVEEMLNTYNPDSEFYNDYNAEGDRKGKYGMLAGTVDGENNYYCWAVDIYKLEDVNFDMLTYDDDPVLVEYLGKTYLVDVGMC